MSDVLKARVYDALKDILRDKGLDKVTVRELAERCGISRQGFYYHFQDIADVFKWKISLELERGMARLLRAKSVEDPLVAVVLTMKEHSSVLKSVLNSAKLRDRLMPVLIDAIQENIRPLLYRYVSSAYLDTERREALVPFLAYGIVGIIVEKSDESNFVPEFIIREIKLLLEARFGPEPRG